MDVTSALRLAREDSYDVLLSDIGLPDGDGWELRRRLVEAGHCPPHSVAMSGFDSPGHVARSRAAGFARYLIKPIDPEMLIQALNPSTSPPALAPHLLLKRKIRFKQ